MAILWPHVLLLGVGMAVDGCGRCLGLEVEETVGGDVDDQLKSRATCSTFSGV